MPASLHTEITVVDAMNMRGPSQLHSNICSTVNENTTLDTEAQYAAAATLVTLSVCADTLQS